MDAIIHSLKCIVNEMSLAPTITYDIEERMYKVLRDYNTIRFNPNTTDRHEDLGRQITRLHREADMRGLPPHPRRD